MRYSKVLFDEETVKGEVIMQTLLGRERLAILKEIKLTPDKDGTLSFNNDTVDAIIKGTELVEKRIESVNLIVNGDVITTFEDLEYSTGFNTVVMKLISTLINGPQKLGN